MKTVVYAVLVAFALAGCNTLPSEATAQGSLSRTITNKDGSVETTSNKGDYAAYLDKVGADLIADGGSLFVDTDGAFIGPGHAGIFSEKGTNWFGMHFYDGSRSGASTLAIRTLQWTTDGWPQLNP